MTVADVSSTPGQKLPLSARISEHPLTSQSGPGDGDVDVIANASPDLATVLHQEPVRRLLAGLCAGSPYLKGLALRDATRLHRFLTLSPEDNFAALNRTLVNDCAAAQAVGDLKAALRRYKSGVALLTALADLGGVWPVMTVTRVLSEAADTALAAAVRFLFKTAAAKGQWRPHDADKPEAGSGYIVLAMGKHGAFELNYSSDIDIIVFFDRARATAAPGIELQPFFVRLTRELVQVMEERTPDGYVFRTDLRLRPDAGATQIAISTDAAHEYYESVGQNWERAAMIKARPVAGDVTAGQAFLDELMPFIWRKNLDYAAIADIHAMKRQIHVHKGHAKIAVAGHDVKLGRGGIREIEFFAQTQQLIAGGRQHDLRVRGTLDALNALERLGWLKPSVRVELDYAYQFLRRIEHRLQMVADEQTHQIPETSAALASFARFCGYPGIDEFSAAVTIVLENVRRHYGELFENAPDLAPSGVNMVFAGSVDDPATVAALTRLGYARPTQVLATVRSWHHGRTPAVRSPRARELLTEVQPRLIEAFAATSDPDAALLSFDRFLAELPAGVQLFSLLKANPSLMRLIADIMGTAPRLSRILSRRRRLLDAVLDPRLRGSGIDSAELSNLIARDFAQARARGGEAAAQDILDRARIIGSEQGFLVGVKLLTGELDATDAGQFYSLIAEALLGGLFAETLRDLESQHGRVPGGRAVILGMGKLGGRELTASSDLDLIVVYDFAAGAEQSDGAKALAPTQYYARLTQRLVTALTAQTPEGTLYDVDLRLRPSGQKGPMATQFRTFLSYQLEEAWTWEHLALTRARVVAGDAGLAAEMRDVVATVLARPRDRSKIAADVRAMRQRIAAEKGSTDVWDLKQVRGGLVDLEFIAQYLQLIHGADDRGVFSTNTVEALEQLTKGGFLDASVAAQLTNAGKLLHDLTHILRLCLDGPFHSGTSPEGLRMLLVKAGKAKDFKDLETKLRDAQGKVAEAFDTLIV